MSEDLAENMKAVLSLLDGDTRFVPHQGWRKYLAPIGEWLYGRNVPAWLIDWCVQVEFDGLIGRAQAVPLDETRLVQWQEDMIRINAKTAHYWKRVDWEEPPA